MWRAGTSESRPIYLHRPRQRPRKSGSVVVDSLDKRCGRRACQSRVANRFASSLCALGNRRTVQLVARRVGHWAHARRGEPLTVPVSALASCKCGSSRRPSRPLCGHRQFRMSQLVGAARRSSQRRAHVHRSRRGDRSTRPPRSIHHTVTASVPPSGAPGACKSTSSPTRGMPSYTHRNPSRYRLLQAGPGGPCTAG